MKKYFLLLFLFLTLLPRSAVAAPLNHYVTVVSPVRGSNLWQSAAAVKKQIELTQGYKIPATWLLQYDLIIDEDNSNLFYDLAYNQELGVFLEVSEKLATDARVAYLLGEGDWARPDKVFLSGYSPSERIRIIDRIFTKFKEKFGFYPSSVGSWYIDTLSLDYMVEKYHIQGALDVADQYSTDKYGVWGKPWGMPYFPSYFNSLLPAKDSSDMLEVVKIQWAQRDPVKGYGLTAADSIFSLQANDYINNGLDIDYFRKLADTYLNSDDPITQLTVGIEAGQEGAVFFEEHKKQLQYLKKLEDEKKITFLTMSSFAQEYKKRLPKLSASIFISVTDYFEPRNEAYWYSSKFYRIGLIKRERELIIRDLRIYPDYFLTNDIFENDTSHQLRKIVPSIIDDALKKNSKTLFSDIEEIGVSRKENEIAISLQEKNGKKHTVSLLPEKILVDKEVIFEASYKNGLSQYIDKLKAVLIINYWLSYPHQWMGSWRFASIDNNFYFGFMVAPDKLIGIRPKFPFFGSFQFPFQTLIRFKSFPKLGIAEFISDYLVKSINNSTIKVSDQHLL